MKKLFCVCAACAALAAAVSCSKAPEKVTAVVACKDAPVALVIEYAAPLAAASVTPEAYSVPGYEVACVQVCDKNPFTKPECCKDGEKPECCKQECKDGQFVVIALKGECCKDGEKPECCKEEKPECCKEEKPECCKEEKTECCKEIPVPEISVQQVTPVQAADGKTVPAWKQAVKATAAVPFMMPKHHGPKPCCDKPAEGENAAEAPAAQ